MVGHSNPLVGGSKFPVTPRQQKYISATVYTYRTEFIKEGLLFGSEMNKYCPLLDVSMYNINNSVFTLYILLFEIFIEYIQNIIFHLEFSICFKYEKNIYFYKYL